MLGGRAGGWQLVWAVGIWEQRQECVCRPTSHFSVCHSVDPWLCRSFYVTLANAHGIRLHSLREMRPPRLGWKPQADCKLMLDTCNWPKFPGGLHSPNFWGWPKATTTFHPLKQVSSFGTKDYSTYCVEILSVFGSKGHRRREGHGRQLLFATPVPSLRPTAQTTGLTARSPFLQARHFQTFCQPLGLRVQNFWAKRPLEFQKYCDLNPCSR